MPGRPTIWMIVGQGSIALAAGAGGRLFNLKQPTNQIQCRGFGWLVGFGLNGPLRQYFSLYQAVSQREGERGEKG